MNWQFVTAVMLAAMLASCQRGQQPSGTQGLSQEIPPSSAERQRCTAQQPPRSH